MDRQYTIGGKTWLQRPLVLGQWKQLLEIIKGISVPLGAGIPQLIELLGPRMSLALAVVLIEESGNGLRSRFGLRSVDNGDGVQVPEWYQNPDVMMEIANEVETGIDAETAMRVIDDFLSCNPVSSILDRLTGAMTSAGRIPGMMTQMASKTSSPASATEISPSETGSSGDSLPASASPISNSTSETSSTASP